MSGMSSAHSNASLLITWPALIRAVKNSNGKPVAISDTSRCSLKLGVQFSLNHLACWMEFFDCNWNCTVKNNIVRK